MIKRSMIGLLLLSFFATTACQGQYEKSNQSNHLSDEEQIKVVFNKHWEAFVKGNYRSFMNTFDSQAPSSILFDKQSFNSARKDFKKHGNLNGLSWRLKEETNLPDAFKKAFKERGFHLTKLREYLVSIPTMEDSQSGNQTVVYKVKKTNSIYVFRESNGQWNLLYTIPSLFLKLIKENKVKDPGKFIDRIMN